jgi:hypothetical protein
VAKSTAIDSSRSRAAVDAAPPPPPLTVFRMALPAPRLLCPRLRAAPAASRVPQDMIRVDAALLATFAAPTSDRRDVHRGAYFDKDLSLRYFQARVARARRCWRRRHDASHARRQDRYH